MKETSLVVKRRWKPMKLSYVGDVSLVMQVKTGPHCDPSPNHTVKRGNGPPARNC